MKEWIAKGEQLREQEADAYRTHIPWYAEALPKNISYMEEGIVHEIQWSNFKRLKEYMNLIIDKEEVTYLEWLHINLSSVEILSERKSTLRSSIYKLADRFPQEISVPTTISEPGIIPFNRGWGKEIHPIGMSRRWRSLHGANRDPVSLAGHDILHIREGRRAQTLFHDKLMERVESLPVKKRKNVELGYNAVTRESSNKMPFGDSLEHIESDITSVLKDFIFQTKNGRGLIDVSGGKEQAIQEVVDDFIEVFHDIQSSE